MNNTIILERDVEQLKKTLDELVQWAKNNDVE